MDSYKKTNRLICRMTEKMGPKDTPSSSEAAPEKAKTTLNELDAKTLDVLLSSDKPAFVLVSATWCKSCTKMIKALEDLARETGNMVTISVLTDDLNEEAGTLYKKLGISKPDQLPTLLFKMPKDSKLVVNNDLPENIKGLSSFLHEKTGIKTSSLEKAQTNRSETEYRKLVDEDPDLFLKEFAKVANEPFAEELVFMAANNIEKKGPFLALMFYHQYSNQPYAKRILEVAARNSAETDVQGALHFFDIYKAEPFADEIVEIAFRNAAKSENSSYVVWFYKILKEREYFRELFDLVAQDEKSVAKIFKIYGKWLPKGHGDVKDLEAFVEYAKKYHPKLVEENAQLLPKT